MKLLELAKKNLHAFISVRKTLELISITQQTPLSYVATFLISQGFESDIPSYDVDKYYVIHSNDNWNWGQFEQTSSILSTLADNDNYKKISVFDDNDVPENLKDTYWKRSDLYNLNLIKDLSIDYYFRAEDIKNIVGNHSLNLDEFEFKDNFSDIEVKKLLKSGIASYLPNSVEKLSLIDDFVKSIIDFFEPDFDKGLIIQKDELKKLFYKIQIIIKDFNDKEEKDDEIIDEFSTCGIVPNIYDENYIKLIEEELSYTPKIEIDVFGGVDKNVSNNVVDLSLNLELNILTKSDYFDIFDSACLVSLDEPSKLNSDINYGDDWKYGEHKQAIKMLNYAILAKELDEDDGLIPRASLQNFLFKRGTLIKGFNDELRHYAPEHKYNKTNDDVIIKEKLKQENEKLKAELLEKEQKIKELASLSCTKDTDLLSLIFDETKKERYSPDLVLSIKLWKHVYIVNPKDVSHSNKADTWLKANTGYDVDKKAGSASKIREITAPFINWSIHRDKAYKK